MNIITKVKSTSILFFTFLISFSCLAQDKTSGNSLMDYKNTLIAVNNEFLKPLFINNYLNNNTYFKETDLSTEDLTKNFKKAQLLLKSMQLTVKGDSLIVCARGLTFYENYLALYRIKQGAILKEKYNKENVNQVLKEIEQLPDLDEGSKLNKSKKQMHELISNYAKRTNALKDTLELELEKKTYDRDSPFYKNIFTKLNRQYGNYPYLTRVIQKAKDGVKTYKKDLEIYDSQNPAKPAINTSTTPHVDLHKEVEELQDALDKAKKQKKEAEDKKKALNNPKKIEQ